ncbi:GNAT family N-acetyltransferase [Proteiniclasticum sp.]|uniref:GNAT family N-acetyltransferase n=1 Tax=Proteiniclasticum sp. TaxID=2053595 RepID=UPI0025D0961F|nr:GNAT family N-acetyltransferase [Proteiniclasticum sp.]
MMCTIIPYTPDKKKEVRMLIEDPFVREDLLGCLEEFPDCGLVAMEKGVIVGVAVFTGKNVITSFTLYVGTSYRKRGVGTKLLLELEKSMRSSAVKEVYCDFQEDSKHSSFVEKNGYPLQFRSSLMTFQGTDTALSDHRIRLYEDQDYEAVHDLLHRAFQKMRKQVGLPLQDAPKSREEAKKYLENRTSIFVLEEESIIKGCIFLDGHEIDKLAVAPEEEGKGFGRALLAAGIKNIKIHHKEATLWVVQGNPAEKLYTSFGFQKRRLHCFHKKILS